MWGLFGVLIGLAISMTIVALQFAAKLKQKTIECAALYDDSLHYRGIMSECPRCSRQLKAYHKSEDDKQ